MAKRKAWFGTALVAGTVVSFSFFLLTKQDSAHYAPGAGGISLSSAWPYHQVVVGVSGAGNPDGADGVALADVDGDGLLDVVSGHEQGLRVTLSFNPGPSSVEAAWPTVTLPAVNMCSAEDAQFADVDADGALDIVAGCETGTGLVEIYFAPAPPNTRAELLVAANWTRVQITAATQRSMRVTAHDIQGDNSLEIVVGGKEGNCGVPPIGEAQVGYYVSETPRTGASWTFEPIEPVGWTQQMYIVDLNGDTFEDIVYTDYDRIDCPAVDNSRRGLRWLESDGADPPGFTAHQISVLEGNHRWFSLYDWDGDGDLDILDCESLTGPPPVSELRWMRNDGAAAAWTEVPLGTVSSVGSCIDSEIADYDNDGDVDIAVSYSHADNASGLVWLRRDGLGFAATYTRGEISGNLDADSDVKFDNIVAHDVDGDGDLDLVSSEQHIPDGTGPGLGVVYLENPLTSDPGVGSGDDGDDSDDSDDAPAGIACVALTSGNDGTSGTTAETAEVTPTANAVVYAAFANSVATTNAAPTGVEGNGLTWVQEETVNWHTSNGRRITVFRAMGASPTTGTIVATWAGSNTSKLWSVIECTGVDTSGSDGAGATVQSTTNTATAATSVTGTLAALDAATSVHLSFSGTSTNAVQTPDADFSQLTHSQNGTGAASLLASWATDETVSTPAFATANAGIISLEVRIAP